LLEILSGLQHDLGKYLPMPFLHLPGDSSQAELSGALERSLRQTRRSPSGEAGAKEIWEKFLLDAAGRLEPAAGFRDLRRTVERALLWERGIGAEGGTLDRRQIERDFCAVSPAIRELMKEISDAS